MKESNRFGFICEIVPAQQMKDAHPKGQWYIPYGIQKLSDPVLKLTFSLQGDAERLFDQFSHDRLDGGRVKDVLLETDTRGEQQKAYFSPSFALFDAMISAGIADTQETEALKTKWQIAQNAASSRGQEL